MPFNNLRGLTSLKLFKKLSTVLSGFIVINHDNSVFCTHVVGPKFRNFCPNFYIVLDLLDISEFKYISAVAIN